MEFAASCICIWRLCHCWLLNLHWLSKTESKYLYWTRRNTIFVPKPDTLFSSLADLIKTSSRKKTQRSHLREYFVFAFLSESEIEILSRRKWECWNNWPDWFNFKKHCQRHNGPEGWVLVTKVTYLGHITNYHTNLEQTSSESRPSTNYKISTKHQQNFNLKILTKPSFRISTKI